MTTRNTEPLTRVEAVEVINKYDHGWRRIIRNFAPSWFAVTMGTGVVSTLLFSIPYQSSATYYLSIVFFVLNLLLFSVATAASLVRYLAYPEIFNVMVHDPKNSLFLGCVPMGFATLVEMVVFVVVPAWGGRWATVAWALWVADGVASVTVAVALGFVIISARTTTDLKEVTATQLLPIASNIVASVLGARVAEISPSPQIAAGTVLASYVLWGMGVPLAMCALVMYYQRLMLHKLPPREVIVSSCLPLGPLGFGGYAILYLGKVAKHAFPAVGILGDDAQLAGNVLYVLGFIVALIMWGFGLVWMGFAVASILSSRPFPFNMGWWGFTFPLGTYAASTILLGTEMPSAFFRVLGTVFASAVIALWLVCAVGTIRGGWTGVLFDAPCLGNLKQDHVDKGLVRVNEKSA